MNQIYMQVRRARRRLVLQRFGHLVSWTLFGALLIALIAIAVPKIWPVEVDLQLWTVAWAGGAFVAGLVAAAVTTYLTRPSLEQTAAEIDHRFALRERLSSSLMLPESERETEAGRALLADAESRAGRIAVDDRFELRPARLGLLPLIPLAMLAILILIPDATRNNITDASASVAAKEDAKQVKTTAAQLKRKLEQQRRQAKAKGLDDAADMFQRMEAKLDKITKRENIDKKEAMIALNDLKKELQDRRDKLGTPNEMKKAMSNLGNLDNGPADRVAKAMQKGDFGDAQKQVQDLAKKLRNGELSEKEQQQLQKQIEQMKEQLEKAAEQHEQAKKDLQEKIEQARRDGRMNDAAKMQEQLNQMEQQQDKIDQMKKMAQGLGNAADAMKQGNGSEAAEGLEDIADQLGQMQQSMDELQDLEASLDDLQQAKGQMQCKQCQGQGCPDCQGGGLGSNPFGQPGNGLGEGQGKGDRPEAEDDTNTYDTQVRGDVKPGRAIIAGKAGGPNRKGTTTEELQQAVLGAIAEESDPMENQSLPRIEREHAKQYFDRLREGRESQ